MEFTTEEREEAYRIAQLIYMTFVFSRESHGHRYWAQVCENLEHIKLKEVDENGR